MNKLQKAGKALASPSIVFYTMIWMMVVLVIGTIAQKYVGLYQAQNTYFFSYIFWLGPVPLPGGMVTMFLISLSLFSKLIFASQWTAKKSGIIITHIGSLLLLFGGIVTFGYSTEGSMTIYEGDTSNYFTDYHDKELTVEDEDTGTIATYSWDKLVAGNVFKVPNTPLKLEIVKVCKNCTFKNRKEDLTNPAYIELQGRAKTFEIVPIELDKDDELNKSAVMFRVIGSAEKDGVHFSADFIDVSPWVTVGDKTYNISLHRKKTVLPFAIEVHDFEKKMHPGTNMPHSYKSEITLIDNGVKWRSIIQMNEPLRYKGYTFFQSSFIQRGSTEATIFTVVKNSGRTFPYIASIVICIGLLIHIFFALPKLIRRMAGKKKGVITLLFLSFFILFSSTSYAETSGYDYEKFSTIPVLDQGRIKPLDTFARTYLEIFSGRGHMKDSSAIEWLAELLLNPDKSYDRNIFNIPNPEVLNALGLEKRKGHRYSYKEVSQAISKNYKSWHGLMRKPESELTLSQKQLLSLYQQTLTYGELSRSLSLVFPDILIRSQEAGDIVGYNKNTLLSYNDLQGKKDLLQKMAKDIFDRVSKITPIKIEGVDRELANLSMKLNEISKDRNSQMLRIIPPQWNEDSKVWFSPWGIGLMGRGSPASAEMLRDWAKITMAYRTNSYSQWNELVEKVSTNSLEMANKETSINMMNIEVSFNNWKPFTTSLVFYLASLIVILIHFVMKLKGFHRTALLLLLAGFVCHLTGLGTRMFIMSRPPVTNIYESIIFVGFISVLCGLFLEKRLKNRMGILIAASIGTVLHFMGMRYDADGDTMGMLVAVLDTNFWLATHVVTITIGYAFCIFAGTLAHVHIIHKLIYKNSKSEQRIKLFQNIRGLLLIAIFFATLGTILGGIWADQSWGRFWGWDPKENGALLIVLWLIFILHGKISGRLKESGFIAYTALSNVIVVLAWFGVNLLSVGLHAYGFTESAAFSFVTFCSTEVLFVLGSYLYIRFYIDKKKVS